MKKVLLLLLIVAHMLSVHNSTAAMVTQSTDLSYLSRGVQVPVTVIIPNSDGPFPLVVMMHGNGDRRNNAGFVNIAEALGAQGIASIRMDFPGCGDSIEDFTKNTESIMKQDVINGLNYAIANYPIDTDRVGTFGYSMGGRLTLELIVDESFPFKAIALLAPAADTDNFILLFEGEDNWNKLKKEALSAKEGYTTYTNIWGKEYTLSKDWFSNIEKYGGKSLIKKAADHFNGPALVIYSVNDDFVSPGVSEAVAEVLEAQVVVVPADGHNYGFSTNNNTILSLVTSATVAFFTYNLKYDTPKLASQRSLSEDDIRAIVNTSDKDPLNFRAADSRGADIIGRIPHGTSVQVLSRGTEWSQVLFNRRRGYVMSYYLDFSAP